MTDHEIDELMKECLPSWAIGRTEGLLVLGAQLPTRDGRRMGNAHIIEIKPGCLNTGKTFFTLLTDAGNQFIATEGEISELFYPPEWVTDVNEVLRRFQRNE